MIHQYNYDKTGWALFSDDMTMRYRLARSLDTSFTNTPAVSAVSFAAGPLTVSEHGIVHSDNSAVFLMLNPSVASAFINDPTVRRGMRFAAAWGCDVYQAANIHPLRSTQPEALVPWVRRMSGDDWAALQRENNEQIRLACIGARYVIAAWGTHGELRGQGQAIREVCSGYGIRLHHLGLTKDGHPKHPLYIKGGTEPQKWPL